MKHGDTVLLKRGNKRYPCTVVSDHTATFPALTVLRGNDEWIVGINEILNPEEIKAEAEAKRQKDLDSVADVVEAFNKRHTTVMAIANALGKQMVQVLSRCRKAERMGLIKLERKPKHDQRRIHAKNEGNVAPKAPKVTTETCDATPTFPGV